MVRGVDQRARRGLIRAVRFHSHQAVFHQVGAAHAVAPADFVQGFDELDRPHPPAIHRHRHAGFKADDHRTFLLRRVLRA